MRPQRVRVESNGIDHCGFASVLEAGIHGPVREQKESCRQRIVEESGSMHG